MARAGEHVVGAVPLLLARSGPIWLPAPVPFPYIGPVTAPQYLDALLHALRTWSARRLVALNRLDFLQAASSQLEVLRANGCDLANATTYLVDLPHGDKEALLLSMSRAARKSLRGAQRHGVSVRAASRKDVDNILPTLLQEAFAAHGQRNPYPRTVGAAVWDAFAHENNTYLAGAYIDGRCVGILAAFGDIHGAFAWAGGCLREVRESKANFALHFDLFVWAQRHGYGFVDLVGEVDEGVAHFKMSLGGTPTPFVMATLPTYRRLWRARSHILPTARATR